MLKSIKESQLSQLFFHSSGAHHFNPQHPLRMALDGWIQSQITCQQLSLSQGACFWVLAPSGPTSRKTWIFSVETWRKAMESWFVRTFLVFLHVFWCFFGGEPMGFPIGFPSREPFCPHPAALCLLFLAGGRTPWSLALDGANCCCVSWMLPTLTFQILQILPERIWHDLTLSRSVQSHLLDSSCLFHICGTCFSLFFPLESLGFPIDPGINSWISWDQLQIHIPNCTCDMSVTEMRGFRSQGGGETGAGFLFLTSEFPHSHGNHPELGFIHYMGMGQNPGTPGEHQNSW